MKMKSIKEYMDQDASISEASKKLLSSPEEIDESNPLVKKLIKACAKNGYRLKKAFSRLNSSGKPSGWFIVAVDGFGPGYHPEIRYNMNGRPGSMFYLNLDLKGDIQAKDAAMYADGLSKGVAMLELLNSLDGTKLPAILSFTV